MQSSADYVATSDLPIILSKSELVAGTGYTFKNYYYTTTNISWQPSTNKYKVCIDSGYTIFIIDTTFISENTEIKTILTSILIRSLSSKLYRSNTFAVITFYIRGILVDSRQAFAKITRKVYIVNNLKAGILIEADIIIPKSIILDFKK